MRIVASIKVALFSVFALMLAGCGWAASNKADNTTGVPITDVVLDVVKTSNEHKQEEHEERVKELENEYEEFVRSRQEIDTNDDDEEQSIMVIKDDQN